MVIEFCDCEWLIIIKFDFKGVEIWLVGRVICVVVKGEVVNCFERYGNVSNFELIGVVWDVSFFCRLIFVILFFVRVEKYEYLKI